MRSQRHVPRLPRPFHYAEAETPTRCNRKNRKKFCNNLTKNEMLNDRLVRWFLRPTPDLGLNHATGMPIAVGTDVGLAREENQDRVAAMRVNANSALNQPFLVVALADGMGGMTNGAECAARTLAAFFNSIVRFRHKPADERLADAAGEANRFVNEYSNGSGGATLSAVLIDADHRFFTLNVGDSRIYALTDGGEQKVLRLTTDDSLEEMVGGHGKELLQFIGMGDGLIPHVSEPPEDLGRVVITSDGVHFIGHELLSDVLHCSETQIQVVDRLITLARWRGAPDNASAAVIFLKPLQHLLHRHEESGVEIWDPFSALHVMWVKQEQFDQRKGDALAPGTQAPSSPARSAKPQQSMEEASRASLKGAVEPPTDKPNSRKRSKASKASKSARSVKRSPQLTIEIEPMNTLINNKEDGNNGPSQ